MTVNERIYSALLLMLAKGEKITVYSLAEKAKIDRNSIYYRIKREVLKNEAIA